MLGVKFVFVGKMREKHYVSAYGEYEKRLAAYCRCETAETTETRLGDEPSEKEIAAALEKEAGEIERLIPKGAYTVALCVEGEKLSSPGLAKLISDKTAAGTSKLCFLVGGSFGLADRVKRAADLRLSMSDMTFPHHLARVMLIEQVYRALSINGGARYHK